eukprot:CAMPEP_0114544108 /NCGR_PEP_ID=MMETSP0114-20121206/2703_1 /TAXON_ID=31324 /ORGANISM="Goniomonas sp, Strain m" /LENGTH=530 /DNA_ID=CAMNT_0001728471 /DNA_START=321 /DNA_END=1913 /DNA_ORIENTATION=-
MSQVEQAMVSGACDAVLGVDITPDRVSKWDFSPPIYRTDFASVLTLKMLPDSSIFRFLHVFDWTLWVALAASTLCLAGVLWGFESPVPGTPLVSKPIWRGFCEALWTACLTLFGHSNLPVQTYPARLVQVLWKFTSFIIIAWYTAALANELMADSSVMKLASVSDLAGRLVITTADRRELVEAVGGRVVEIAYGAETNIAEQLKQGVADAGVMHGGIANAAARRECQLVALTEVWRPLDVAIAFPQAVNGISKSVATAVFNLTESGVLTRLTKAAFGPSECRVRGVRPPSAFDLRGVFYASLIALGLSLVLVAVTWGLKRSCAASLTSLSLRGSDSNAHLRGPVLRKLGEEVATAAIEFDGRAFPMQRAKSDGAADDGAGTSGLDAGTTQVMLSTVVAQLSEVMVRLDRQAVVMNSMMSRQSELERVVRKFGGADNMGTYAGDVDWGNHSAPLVIDPNSTLSKNKLSPHPLETAPPPPGLVNLASLPPLPSLPHEAAPSPRERNFTTGSSELYLTQGVTGLVVKGKRDRG